MAAASFRRTVKVYLSIIYKKLAIQNRTQLAIWAILNERNVAA